MKNNKVFAVLFLLVLSFVMPKNLKSQMIEVGATASIPYYVGDLNPDKHFSNVKPSFGVVLRYYQNLRWAFRLQYSHYNLQVQPTQGILNQIPEYANEEIINSLFIIELMILLYWQSLISLTIGQGAITTMLHHISLQDCQLLIMQVTITKLIFLCLFLLVLEFLQNHKVLALHSLMQEHSYY